MTGVLGIDVGGTFTDVVFVDAAGRLQVAKQLNAAGSAEAAVRGALRATGDPGGVETIVYGTTIATNAAIERTGARTALVTTQGFRDVLELQRQNRSYLWDLYYRKPAPLVARDLRLEVAERIDFRGETVVALDAGGEEVAGLLAELEAAAVESVAVCFLNAYANGAHEEEMLVRLRAALPDVYVSLSSRVAPQFREYDRMSTTVLNAYLAPIVARALEDFEQRVRGAGFPADVLIIQSNGGVLPAQAAAGIAASLCVSGPAGGVLASATVAGALGVEDFICVDMGGTSTDVSLVTGGRPPVETDGQIGGLPNILPSFKIETVGSGGGSIVHVDEGGMLQVGPQSAGASPGPACYGSGGISPTVTDAWCALGVLRPRGFGGGAIELDAAAARTAVEPVAGRLGASVEDAYWQAVRVATATMSQAVHLVSTRRGYDPREFALVAYGGAGPLHAALVAAELRIGTIVVPPSPGVFSAYGMLCADLRRDYVQTRRGSLASLTESDVARAFRPLEEKARAQFAELGVPGEVEILRALDLRYEHQAYELQVPYAEGASIDDTVARFHDLHHATYGFSERGSVVEVVTYRVHSSVARAAPVLRDTVWREAEHGLADVYLGEWLPCRFVSRESIRPGEPVEGPTVIEEPTATTLVPPGWTARRDGDGVLWLEAQGGRP